MPYEQERRRTDRASGLAGLSLSGSGATRSVQARQSPLDVIRETRTPPPLGYDSTGAFGYGIYSSEYGFDPVTAPPALASDYVDYMEEFRGATNQPTLAGLVSDITSAQPSATTGSAGGDDALTRTPSDFIGNKKRMRGATVIESAYDRYRSIFENNLAKAQEAATAQYRDRISKLEDELAGYKGGLEGVNKAYSEYADDADAILSQAASVDPVPLPDSAIAQQVGDSYEYFSGPIQDALMRIGETGNAELAKEMGAEFRYMEEAIVDGIRSKVQSQTELHNLAGAQAQALANMAWKDDAYQSEKARYTLELQIKQAMTDKEEQIAEVRDAMDKELEAIRKNAGEFDMAPDELWGMAMQDYLVNAGLDPMEVQDMNDIWEGLLVGDATVNFSKFKSNMVTVLNETNFARLGILDAWNTFISILSDSEDPNDLEKLRKMNAIMANPLGPSAAKAAILELIKSGVPGAIGDGLKDFDWDTLEDIRDEKYQTVLDLWSVYDDFNRNYNDYVTSPKSTYVSSGSQAPNNYANRNQPEYQYRREVVAPYFATQIESLFPGTEIGGLGYIRPPSDTGGGKAKNSDHQSGGAIDVYYKKGNPEESNAQLRRIAAWARDTPGISLVVFEGKKSHEKKNSVNGHVHLSFNVGYRPPGA